MKKTFRIKLFLILIFFFLFSDSLFASGGAFNFIQFCDPQIGKKDYEKELKAFRKAAEKADALNADFAVICGDLVESRDDRSFNDFKKALSGLTMSCYCVPGNHDIGNKGKISDIKCYREIIGPDRYSFEHKGYTFVFCNTQLWKSPVEVEKETKEQDDWLKKVLGKAVEKKSPVFIIGHYPLFIMKPEEKENYFNIPIEKRKELLDLFQNSGVVAVLTGHAHELIIKKYEGIQLVSGETTSVNFDDRPLGFRLWTVTSKDDIKHVFVPLEE